jgi:hypothetical protein
MGGPQAGVHPQPMPGRQLPGPATGPQPYQGGTMASNPFGPDTGPIPGGPGRVAHSGRPYPGPEGPPDALTAERFRRPQR